MSSHRSYVWIGAVALLVWVVGLSLEARLLLADAAIVRPIVEKVCSPSSDARACLEIGAGFSRLRSQVLAQVSAVGLGGVIAILGALSVWASVEGRKEAERRLPADYSPYLVLLLGGALVAVGLLISTR